MRYFIQFLPDYMLNKLQEFYYKLPPVLAKLPVFRIILLEVACPVSYAVFIFYRTCVGLPRGHNINSVLKYIPIPYSTVFPQKCVIGMCNFIVLLGEPLKLS